MSETGELNSSVLTLWFVVAFIRSCKYPRPVKGINKKTDTHHYRCVSDVEGRPVEIAPQTEVNEVSDKTQAETVYEIAQSTTHKQADSYYAQGSSRG